MSETTLDTFRSETRAWLEANCPPEMRVPAKSEADVCWGGKRFRFQSEAQRVWLQRMGERGWTVPTWPREYGGGGLSHREAAVLRQCIADEVFERTTNYLKERRQFDRIIGEFQALQHRVFGDAYVQMDRAAVLAGY